MRAYFILLVLILTACTTPPGVIDDLTQKDPFQEASLVCNPPYIINVNKCCLDQNTDNVCDTQEPSQPPITPPAISSSTFGINLASIDYYSPQLLFLDGMKAAAEWTTSNADLTGQWDTATIAQIPVDTNGYPLELPYSVNGQPQIVKTLLYWDLEGHYPSGIYTVLYNGQGELGFIGASIIQQEAGRYEIKVDASQGGVILLLKQSTKGNPIHNIRVYPPGFDHTQTFNPALLNFLTSFSTIRFMDLQKTNFNPLTTWEDRPTISSYTQSTPEGIAMEHLIELANTADKHVWINIPAQADDAYIRNLARLLKNNLETNKIIYLEYSNEVWNGIFTQTQWIQQQGCSNPLTHVDPQTASDTSIIGCEDLLAGLRYQAQRSADIYRIFNQEFGNDPRIINVVASQTSNTWLFDRIFEAMANEKLNPTNEKIEAIAIAPYFGASIADDLVEKNEVDSITVNQILDRAELDIQTNVNNWMTTMSHYATTHTVQLLAYEGGQHLRATNAGLNNDVLTQKLIAANIDPRMKELYTLYLTQWKQVGGGLFVHFSSIVKPTKWGSWGLLEYTGQPASEAPKYQAVKEFVPTSLPPVIPPVEEPPVTPPSDLPPPTSTLLAYWNFDNNVQDQSGNNYHLQNHNVNCNVPGKINQGCLIGNNAESLDITPYPLAQNAQAFSFATFVNFQGNEGEKHIMSLGFESFGLKYFGHGEFHCILRNSNGDFLYNHDDNFWPVIGQWHHVACTYNPTDKTLRFYVDGQLNEAFVVPTFDSFKDLPQSGMGVGCKKPGFCEGPVPGFPIVTVTMDEAKLYTTTLTDQQVLKLSRGESF